MKAHKHVPDKEGLHDFCAKCGKARYSEWHAVVKKPADWEREKKQNYQNILLSLCNLKEALDKEDPTSLFVWTIESKIRAYTRKLNKITKESQNDNR